MRKFLEHLLHYQCARCYPHIPRHPTQDKTGGRHSHNGEFWRMTQGIAPSSDALLAAYQAWLNRPDLTERSTDGVKGECRQQLAAAMRRPGRIEPQDAEQRALRILVDHWDSTYIRHGPESLRQVDYDPNQPFPPLASRYYVGEAVMAPNSQWYAVDLDRPPFRVFEEHVVELSLGPPWVYIAGFTPVKIFHRGGGELFHPQDRDHYYARSQVLTRHWVFLYREPDDSCEQPDAVWESIHRLKRSGVPRIHHDDYNFLVRVMHNWQTNYEVRKFLRA
jgi:hypothetical protein